MNRYRGESKRKGFLPSFICLCVKIHVVRRAIIAMRIGEGELASSRLFRPLDFHAGIETAFCFIRNGPTNGCADRRCLSVT